jgi:hypothetical protein
MSFFIYDILSKILDFAQLLETFLESFFFPFVL